VSDWDAAADLILLKKIRLAAEHCHHCRDIWDSLLGHLKAHEHRFVAVGIEP